MSFAALEIPWRENETTKNTLEIKYMQKKFEVCLVVFLFSDYICKHKYNQKHSSQLHGSSLRPSKHMGTAAAGRWEDKPKHSSILFLTTCHYYNCQQIIPWESHVVVLNKFSKLSLLLLALLNYIWTCMNPQMSALKPHSTHKTAKRT